MRWFCVLLLVVATACSAPSDSWPTGQGELVLRVVDSGGLVDTSDAYELPEFSLYGDGLLILPGKPVVHRRLTVDGVRRVMRAAIHAGLSRRQDFGTPRIIDAPVSTFTVVTGERVQNKVVAPFELSAGNPAQSEARRRVHTFRKGLNDLDSWLGKEIGPAVQPPPGPYLVYSYRTQGQAPAAQWPYGDLPDGGCQLLAAERVSAPPEASPGKVWRQGDSFFYVVSRPLLPDEKGCADIK